MIIKESDLAYETTIIGLDETKLDSYVVKMTHLPSGISLTEKVIGDKFINEVRNSLLSKLMFTLHDSK